MENRGIADAFDWMSFYYLKEFEQLTGSDFHLKTAFKNTLKHGGNSCQKTKLRLIGTEGVISIHFSIPGCVADNLIYLNGNFIRGNENDLSFLGCDFSGFIPIQVKKEGKIFQLTKDDKVVFQDTLAYDLGKIAGMSFHFMGAGAIDYVHFTNKEQVLIQDNFQ